MNSAPNIEQAIERAKRVQADRISAIQSLAEARQSLKDVTEQADRERAELEARISEIVNEAERADRALYRNALKLGWTPTELKDIGFTEPPRARPARKRTAKRAPAKQSAPQTEPTPQQHYPSDSEPTP